MKTFQLHPDAPEVPGFTDGELKKLLVADLSDAIESRRPSIFALNKTMQALLARCDYFPHRDEILQILDAGTDEIKKTLS